MKRIVLLALVPKTVSWRLGKFKRGYLTQRIGTAETAYQAALKAAKEG